MFRLRTLALVSWMLALVPAALRAQDQGAPPPLPVVDSIEITGNSRLTAQQVLGTSGLLLGQPTNYRDLQRAIIALFKTGQFDDVSISQVDDSTGKVLLRITVKERPMLQRWALKGNELLTGRTLKEKIRLSEGRPLDRAAVERARASIDSIYKAQGYYAASVKVIETNPAPGQVGIVFDITEGGRVAISQVVVDGNQRFSDKVLVKHMGTKPEGFFWWQKGKYEDDKLQQDIRERLPNWYGSAGYIDFQVISDSIAVDSTRGKAVLHLAVEEGQSYKIGGFQITGNRRFSTEDLMALYPFGPTGGVGQPFNSTEWSGATENVSTLYSNNGYIYAQIVPEETRRTGPNGEPLIDLRWNIREGQPATINKINIVGNDVTHERVVREAIVMAPGELFNRDRLIQSYRNIANLGFFQQPMAPPDVKTIENGVDVDVTFRVEERRTGNINFGASLGQGTGLGGFLGLEEPNLFGRGKRGKLLWQFGRNINDFTLSYTDPAIRESRTSGTITLFNSRQRFTVGDLGRRRQVGGSVQLGFPFMGSRFTRVYGSYGLQQIKFTGGSEDLRARYSCSNCTRSTLGGSIVRDTRFGLPFATGGALTSASLEFNGGVLGGTGNYRKLDFESRYYAPLGTMGGNEQLGSGVQFVLGLTAKSGFIFGDAGPFFTELYSLGGTQFGIPLRGYDEFSITPNGFDPTAGGSAAASPDAFGKAYAAFTVEAGARVSQSLYFSTFLDAGNVYRSASQYDPSRLFRGAGFGVAVLSPLGPIGIDLGYGFDRVTRTGKPDPGWKLHFKLGNFF
ncbi:MAG TPA: outer membrane protein assembly factor BamA [Gemmatimonadales bacterium]|nr:outer membrane protein assembly factor BamA [Gemmatimonadales bacterium]